jgi:hypothetical protein
VLEKNKAESKKWAVPLLCLLIGLVYLGAFWLGGNPGAGLGGLAIMVGYGSLLLAGGRSDIVRVLRGQPADERYRSFDLRATAFAGVVTIFVLIGGFVYEVARGQDGQPFSLLGFVAAVSYLAALLWLRHRS